MQFEEHTLPIVALGVFVATFGWGLYASDTTENRLQERSLSFRTAPFGNQAAQVVSSIGASGENPVAHWSFDEGASITVLDKSGNANTGIINGSPTWTTGKEGNALFFDGEDDYVFVVTGSALNTADTFTIASWIKPDVAATGVVLSKNGLDPAVRGGYELALSAGRFAYSVQGWATLTAGDNKINPFDWTYVVLTFDVSKEPNTSLYVNGKHLVSSSFGAPENATNSLLIGRNNKGEYFRGHIDEVRIYDKALSMKEVRELYTAYTERSEGKAETAEDVPLNAFSRLFGQFRDNLAGVFSSL